MAVRRGPPRAIDLAHNAASFDAIAGPDDWYYRGIGAERRDCIVRLLDECLPQGRLGRALDLGCGAGYWSRELTSRGWSVTAVDLSPRAIETARRTDSPFSGNCDYLVGDWRDFLGDKSYDVILLVGELISYVEDISDLAVKCVRSLTTGGCIIGTAVSLSEAVARSSEQGVHASNLNVAPLGAMLYWERTPWEHPDTPIAAVGRSSTDILAAFRASSLIDMRPIGRSVSLSEEQRRIARSCARPGFETTDGAAIIGFGVRFP